MTPFRKMHGLGNDFVVLDARAADLALTPARIRALGDRRRGVGFDQLLVLEPTTAGADLFLRIWNPDGTEAEACGNGTRCVASLVGHASGVIRTRAGDLGFDRGADGQWVVDMGPAALDWAAIPLATRVDTLHVPLAAGPLRDPAACALGNPHATFFVDDAGAIDLAALGPVLEHAAIFPTRANIGVVQVLAPDRLRLRVWERGAGLTEACGSAACAAVVNAHRRGLAARAATVELPGGPLTIEWRATDGHVLMRGAVATAFTGVLDLDGLPA